MTLTYGVFVAKLLKDANDHNAMEVNEQLDQIGYNMGCRMIDEFFARTPSVAPCQDLPQTAELIAKQAFKMFLGTTADVSNWDKDKKSCSLVLRENPLADFVVLPPQYRDLWYSNVLCGIIRGALEMVNLKAKVYFLKDVLKGDKETEIRLELL